MQLEEIHGGNATISLVVFVLDILCFVVARLTFRMDFGMCSCDSHLTEHEHFSLVV